MTNGGRGISGEGGRLHHNTRGLRAEGTPLNTFGTAHLRPKKARSQFRFSPDAKRTAPKVKSRGKSRSITATQLSLTFISILGIKGEAPRNLGRQTMGMGFSKQPRVVGNLFAVMGALLLLAGTVSAQNRTTD